MLGYFKRFGLERGVRVIEGFFDETLPSLRGRRWSLLRLDGDTYESTWVALDALYPGLSAGGYVIVDDYRLIRECRAAVDDYRREHDITTPIEKNDWCSARWRREDEPRREAAATAAPEPKPARAPAPVRARDSQLPTERELALERQVDELRERPRRSGQRGTTTVIAFGVAVTSPAAYDRYALPGIKRVAEADSLVMAHQTAGSIFHNYNLLLDQAGARDDLEALVLPHQDTEIVDPEFLARVREALVDPDVAVIGCAGAVGVRGPAWWQGAVTWASHSHRYHEYGGGEFPGMTWAPESAPSHASPGEVDSVDGFILVLSAWAVRNLRFDESLGKLHAYDFDICMQARAAGKKVVTANFRAVHHRRLELLSDPEAWIAAYVASVEKWQGQLPDTGADPERRALRAEAEAACARVMTASESYRKVAIERQLGRVNQELDELRPRVARLERALEAETAKLRVADRELEREHARFREVVESSSWRLTGPLRALRRRFRRRR